MPESPKKMGRPEVSDAEKMRRGTFEPGRARAATATRRGRPPKVVVLPRDYGTIARQYVADVLSGDCCTCNFHRGDAMIDEGRTEA